MPRKGRPPKSPELKLIEGNRSKKRPSNNHIDGFPPLGEPSNLLAEGGAQYWNILKSAVAENGIARRSDTAYLEIMCELYADYRTCLSEIEAHGAYYETTSANGNTIRRRHPALDMKRRTEKALISMFEEFGMTPSSRMRLLAPLSPPNPNDRFFE